MRQIDNIISRARERLPYQYRKTPWKCIKDRRWILNSENELNAYLCAYGEMHKVKCYSALQNFPYNELPQRIEIVDWGCGQGVATICLMDCLYDRGLLQRLKKVTLIEPSQVAISRAAENINNALSGRNVEVKVLQKYLPSSTPSISEIRSLEMLYPGTIHLFSNILDLTSVNLRATASIIEAGNGLQFIVCMGPVNANAGRIDEFSAYFSNATLFSDICNPRFGITSDTYHPFGCKTKGFYFTSSNSQLQQSVVEGHYTDEGAYDDYDLTAMVRNGLISEDLLRVYQFLCQKLSSNDKIFLNPDINGDKPDIVVVRPGKGILVLDIFDQDVSTYLNNNGLLERNDESRASPLSRVFAYRDNIIESHSTKILRATVTDNRAWYIVRPAVWFTNSNRIDIESTFINENQHRKKGAPRHHISGVITLSKDDFNVPDIWNYLDLKYNKNSFSKAACDEFLSILTPQWHAFNEGDTEISLTRRQQDLSQSEPGRIMRVRGCAGSGKTQVLASTAVKCQLRTGRPVLILTYNITLANYIRYRLGRVPADFPWNKFYITNYHNFFTTQAKNHNRKINLASYGESDFFYDIRDSLPKFSAILIDEAQDYSANWFSILYENFLEEGGEFVVFGDENQDIYRKHVFGVMPNLGGHVWGRWTELNIGHRVTNQNIVDLAVQFQNEFLQNGDPIIPAERELAFDAIPKYCYLRSDSSPDEIVSRILGFVNSEQLDLSQTVILSQLTEVLRDIEYAYRAQTGRYSMTTCETKEVYAELLRKESGRVTNKFKESIEDVRSNKKQHFTMVTDLIKVSTIYSFKGWEADNFFLIIQDAENPDSLENRPEIIYTALTRARHNLYIINLGNNQYHNFFQQHIL